MEKRIVIALGMIFLIGIVSAYYAGETIVIPNELGYEDLVYALSGNTSIVNLIVEVNLTNISITFPSDMIPDSFNIIFMKQDTKEVAQIIYVGGGSGGGTKYIYKNNTEYIEVPKEVVKEVNKECEVNNCNGEALPETVEKKSYFWWFLFGGFLVLLVILWLITRSKIKEVPKEKIKWENEFPDGN